MINTVATTLYRSPDRIFAAADRGEAVTIRRKGREYVLTRKAGQYALYGCNRSTLNEDAGKPVVKWKALA